MIFDALTDVEVTSLDVLHSTEMFWITCYVGGRAVVAVKGHGCVVGHPKLATEARGVYMLVPKRARPPCAHGDQPCAHGWCLFVNGCLRSNCSRIAITICVSLLPVCAPLLSVRALLRSRMGVCHCPTPSRTGTICSRTGITHMHTSIRICSAPLVATCSRTSITCSRTVESLANTQTCTHPCAHGCTRSHIRLRTDASVCARMHPCAHGCTRARTDAPFHARMHLFAHPSPSPHLHT